MESKEEKQVLPYSPMRSYISDEQGSTEGKLKARTTQEQVPRHMQCLKVQGHRFQSPHSEANYRPGIHTAKRKV
ncbi:hypothetical protein D5086_011298 [Populus alba]|uniref:Uncharacterized protein n=1 Tax=Populus alba TaxID=43335 RepID=A0ACC4CBS9_POPAL